MKDSKGSLMNVRVLKKSMIFLQSYDEIIPIQVLKTPATFATCGKLCDIWSEIGSSGGSDRTPGLIQAFYHLSTRLRVLFGTVQYCKYFMRKAECRNETCVFLHARDKKNQIIVNDQIDEDVYDDHYDMALKIAEEDNFKTLRNILANTTIQDTNIIKKGLKLAVQDLNIDILEPGSLAPQIIPKQTELFQQSTEESELVESREEVIQKKQQEISKEQKVNQNFSAQDYIKIRLIKKLIREKKSKIYVDEGINEQHIHNRSKMILYRIVKY